MRTRNAYDTVSAGGMDVHYKFSQVTMRDEQGRVVRRERVGLGGGPDEGGRIDAGAVELSEGRTDAQGPRPGQDQQEGRGSTVVVAGGEG